MSEQFFGWVLGLGNGIKIVEPDDIREKLKNYLDGVRKLYE